MTPRRKLWVEFFFWGFCSLASIYVTLGVLYGERPWWWAAIGLLAAAGAFPSTAKAWRAL